MAEIDLIPSDYRMRLVRMSWLRTTGIAVAWIVAASVSAWSGLGLAIQSVNGEIDDLRSGIAAVKEKRTELSEMVAVRDEKRRRLESLAQVNDGSMVERMFFAIDRALPGDAVWFQTWEFHQQETPVAVSDRRRVRNGHKPRKGNRMEIRGQARDHAALSRFVDGLLGQPEIGDVQISGTRRNGSGTGGAIDFEVTVVVVPGART